MPLSTTEFESKLWGAADILRGQIDSSDYKNYILSMLFLKRLSDRFAEEVERAVADGVTREVAERDPDEHQFFGCVVDGARAGARSDSRSAWPGLSANSLGPVVPPRPYSRPSRSTTSRRSSTASRRSLS